MSDVEFLPVPVAHNLDEASELATGFYGSQIPGFQYEPRSERERPNRGDLGDVLDLMEVLEEASEQAIGEPVYFLSLPLFYMAGKQLLPHIDGGHVGASIHWNYSGPESQFELAFPGEGFTDMAVVQNQRLPWVLGREYDEMGNINAQTDQYVLMGDVMPELVDVVYQGTVHPGSLTVFAQGGLVRTDGTPLQRGIHNFQNEPVFGGGPCGPERRDYTRISTSNTAHNKFSPETRRLLGLHLKARLMQAEDRLRFSGDPTKPWLDMRYPEASAAGLYGGNFYEVMDDVDPGEIADHLDRALLDRVLDNLAKRRELVAAGS